MQEELPPDLLLSFAVSLPPYNRATISLIVGSKLVKVKTGHKYKNDSHYIF